MLWLVFFGFCKIQIEREEQKKQSSVSAEPTFFQFKEKKSFSVKFFLEEEGASKHNNNMDMCAVLQFLNLSEQ